MGHALRERASTALIAGGIAGVVSGIPSTVYLLLTEGDLFASLNALVAMVTSSELPVLSRICVAAAVHLAVSVFWASVLVLLMPRRAPMIGALIASAVIAFVDLKLIAPSFFAEAAALAFIPQLADHLAWGATVGAVLRMRSGTPDPRSGDRRPESVLSLVTWRPRTDSNRGPSA